jgi:hypothetical protein
VKQLGDIGDTALRVYDAVVGTVKLCEKIDSFRNLKELREMPVMVFFSSETGTICSMCFLDFDRPVKLFSMFLIFETTYIFIYCSIVML